MDILPSFFYKNNNALGYIGRVTHQAQYQTIKTTLEEENEDHPCIFRP